MYESVVCAYPNKRSMTDIGKTTFDKTWERRYTLSPFVVVVPR